MSEYYVYELAYPDGIPFYRGKGTGNRIDQHEDDALHSETRDVCNPRKVAIIKDVLGSGKQLMKRKLAFFADEQEAYMYEWAMIYMTADAELLVNGQDVGSPRRLTKITQPTRLWKQTSIRLSSEAQESLRRLVQKLGISQSDVLELAIRRLAEQEHVRESA